MGFFLQMGHEQVGNLLRVRLVTQGNDDEREVSLLRSEHDLRMRVLDVDPEALQHLVWVIHLVSRDTALVHADADHVRLSVDEEGEREGGNKDENAEDNVSEDESGNRGRDGENARGPEPVSAALFMLVFRGFPFNREGRNFFHSPNYITT